MNGVLGHFFALSRLNCAGDNLDNNNGLPILICMLKNCNNNWLPIFIGVLKIATIMGC